MCDRRDSDLENTYDGVPVEVLDAAGRVADSVILHCLVTEAEDLQVAALGHDVRTVCEWVIAVQQAIVEAREVAAGQILAAADDAYARPFQFVSPEQAADRPTTIEALREQIAAAEGRQFRSQVSPRSDGRAPTDCSTNHACRAAHGPHGPLDA